MLPIVFAINIFVMPFGSAMTQRNINPKILITIGCSVSFPCFYIASFMSNFAGFATLYIIGFSFNLGMFYMIAVHHGWLWFPKNPGLVSGIILAGISLGNLVYDNFFTHLINPDNLSVNRQGFYPDSVDERFIMTWRIMVSTYLLIALAGFFMIFPGPVKKKKAAADVNKEEVEEPLMVDPVPTEPKQKLIMDE